MNDKKREVLLELLSEVELEEPIQLPLEPEEIKELLFEKNEDHYIISELLKPILNKIDFSNVSFDNVAVNGIDFSGLKGVKINPQTIYNKDLSKTICHGVEFVYNDNSINQYDYFKEVNINFTNFKGSKNAKINPQTIKNNNLHGAILSRVDFTGYSFDKACVNNVDFTGSKGVKINPQTIWNKTLWNSKCCDVEFIGSFDNACVRQTNFTGSKGAKINPKMIYLEADKSPLEKTVFCDVEFIDTFENVDIRFANFKGSKNAIIDPQRIKSKNLHGTVLFGIDFTGYSFDDVRVNNVDFTGSKGVKINPQTINGTTLWNTICCDVEFIGSFDNVCVCKANFKGSKGAIINPNKVKKDSINPDLKETICCDVTFTELPSKNVIVENADFTGSNYDQLMDEIRSFEQSIKQLIKKKTVTNKKEENV